MKPKDALKPQVSRRLSWLFGLGAAVIGVVAIGSVIVGPMNSGDASAAGTGTPVISHVKPVPGRPGPSPFSLEEW